MMELKCLLGTTGDAVYQYNLTTRFDISTATYAQNISVDDASHLDSYLVMTVQNYLW